MVENRNLSVSVIAGLLRAADVVAVALGAFVAYFVRFGNLIPEGNAALVILFVTVVAANVFHALRIYEHDRIIREPMQLQRLGLGLLAITFLALAIGYLTKTSVQYSRIWISTWGLFSLAFLVTVRIGLHIQFRRWQAKGWLTRRIAVVGAGPQGQRVVRHLSESRDPSVALVGVFDDRRSRVPNQIGDQAVRGSVEDLLDTIRCERVDEVIVALPWSAERRLLELLKKLRSAPIHVRLCPEGIAFQFVHRPFSLVDGVTMLNAFDRPLSSWASVIKKVEDRLLSLLFLVFIAPLMLAVALAIKLDSRGPVIFRQRRYGFNSQLFEVYKFRTLFHEQTDWNDEVQVSKLDTRITRVGRFLRRSRIDELPQLINVLKGDMSIVGPRPHATRSKAEGTLFEEVIDEYFARHRVKPGITGWAQVNGWTGETDTREKLERRVQYDLEYIEHWSVWLDLKIILLTPFTMFTGEAS